MTYYTFQERPKAGQKQRIGSGDWEQATNRQQRKIVRVYDSWSAKIKKALRSRADRGATIPELSTYLDSQIPILEEQLIEVTNQGILKAVKIAAGTRADLPSIQGIADRQIRENVLRVRNNLVPSIFASLTVAIAGGAILRGNQLNQALNATRSMPAQYAGGSWVAIFETEKGLGQQREAEREAEGLAIEPVRWDLDPRAVHCKPSAGFFGCPELAGVYPGGWNTLPTVPAGIVTCRGNCRCRISVFREGKWQRGVFGD